ncbi:MAG TPA: substrate-binding domain-containing protein [Capsulimonadaceae bacterium]|jgi:LacI family transcriptional regulator
MTSRPLKSFSPLAPYQRIEQDLRDRLALNEWPVGSAMPSRRDLAEHYGVELNTLQRAMAALTDEKLLQGDGRRGTVVLAIPSQVSVKPGGTAATRSTLLPEGTRIGVVVGGVNPHTWNHILLRAVQRQITKAGGVSMVRTGHDSAASVLELIDAGCTAIIFDAIHTPMRIDEVVNAVDGRVPLVIVASEDVKRPVLSVYYDSYDVGYQAGEYFVRKGVSDIAYVATSALPWAQLRLAGIRAALSAYGYDGDALAVTTVLERNDAGRYIGAGQDAAEVILSRRVPAAVICCNDNSATGFYNAAKSMGIEAGRDFALMGFDDEPEATLLDITTFQPPLEQIGAETARLAIEALTKGTVSQKICLHSHLIERSSTSCILQQRRALAGV